ncbi:MAG: ATP-binding protein [Candidatus Omnitrophica bacterium]|nr:ATP-binding protein [Candidatus Omnitrophota bacterium]
MTTYQKREIASSIVSAVESMPVVVLSGMRQTGKSTLIKNLPELKGWNYLTFDDLNTLEAAKRDPDSFLDQGAPLIIDEVQRFPEILLAIKRNVDHSRRPGRFLLSGSANFLILKKVADSLAGRAVYFTLYPFSRRETLSSTRAVPAVIKILNDDILPRGDAKPIVWSEILRGGMPSICLREVKDPRIWFKGYEQTYLERDIRSLSEVGDLVLFRNLLRMVALRNGQVLNLSDLARDVKSNHTKVSRYLDLMEISFVLYRLAPYLNNPTTRLIKAPKIYFADTGLAAYLVGEKTIGEHPLLKGALWENYIFQNLQAILVSHCPEAKYYYWNIQGRHEVDLVIENGDRVMAVEIKFGSRIADSDLTGLKAFQASRKTKTLGCIVYNGSEIFKAAENIWAVPADVFLA